MQSIAREMAFSESTFIFPAEKGGDVRMRIFTPGEELPMAGHPTIGSTFALAIEGTIPRGREGFVFELGVGPTPVSLEWDENRSVVRVDDAAAAGVRHHHRRPCRHGGGAGDRERTRWPAGCRSRSSRAACRSCSSRSSSRAAVDAVAIDRRALVRACKDAGHRRAAGVSVHDRGGSGRGDGLQPHARARFRHRRRIPRPAAPADRSALTCCTTALFRAERHGQILSLQGAAMGRPSQIHIAIEGQPDRITRVRVGGRSVLVGRGELMI